MATAANPQAMNPELERYKGRFENARLEFNKLVRGLSDVQFNLRPEAERWSAAECFDKDDPGSS